MPTAWLEKRGNPHLTVTRSVEEGPLSNETSWELCELYPVASYRV